MNGCNGARADNKDGRDVDNRYMGGDANTYCKVLVLLAHVNTDSAECSLTYTLRRRISTKSDRHIAAGGGCRDERDGGPVQRIQRRCGTHITDSESALSRHDGRKTGPG